MPPTREPNATKPKLKPKRKPVVKTKAPVSDVRSSGTNYGTKRAESFKRKPAYRKAVRESYKAAPVKQRKQVLKAKGPEGETARKLHGERIREGERRLRESARSPKRSPVLQAKTESSGSRLAAIRAGVAAGTVAGLPLAKAADLALGGKGLETALKVAKNAPKDAAEIAVTTPSSLYRLGDTLIHHPEKVPGMLAEPYKQLAKDPAKFITEKPVSSVLMAQPAVRVPGRVVGKAARVTGKQTLKRTPAVVPGTALRVERHRSKDAFVNAAQAKRDRKGAVVVAKPKDVKRRVDSFYDASVKAESRARTKAAKEAKAQRMSPEEGEAHIRAAVKAAKVESNRAAVREFGATGRPGVPAAGRREAKAKREAAEVELAAAREGLTPLRVRRKLAVADARVAKAKVGTGVPPKQHDALIAALADEQAAGVRVRGARETARTAKTAHIEAKQAFREGGVVDDPGAQVGRLYAEKAEAQAVRKSLPFDAVVVKVDNEFGVVPKQVWERVESSPGKAVPHRKVGTSPAVGARVFRVSRGLFTRSVLPLSKNYVAGQVFESAGRSAVMGAGPTSWMRGRKILKASDKQGHGQAVRDRVFGEHYGEQGPIREFLGDSKTLKETFPESRGAAAMTKAAGAPVLKQVRAGYRAWTEAVMKTNAAVERQAQTAMLGKAAKEGPLMERSIIGLTDKAVSDAARGLMATEAQVKLGAEIERAYGKYQRFSPAMRETMLHSTPFLPWYINTATFLTRVLPRDHPVLASLTASLGMATEEWRKEKGLSLYSENPLPDFLYGTGPDNTPIGRFLPFAPKDTAGALGGLFLPQFASAVKNLGGTDWKGDKLPEGQANHAANAVLSLASGLVPGVAQADRVTGISKHHLNESKDPSVLDGKSTREVIEDLKRMVNPLAKPKKKPKAESSSGRPVLRPRATLKKRPVLKSRKVVLK